ncbi:hypothetical protein BHE74_00001009 [Ensete ventricosum]|nr:hypothetical protein GW17_00019763 [Ensete ventricosum]RWW89899.1 hypothetical protein BHE74_00001009 [Ensete ventricosum]RZS26411.1 hypothetical protein BHM03_00059747 [Ensete ventricosum]
MHPWWKLLQYTLKEMQFSGTIGSNELTESPHGGLAKVNSIHRVDAIGNSPGVHRKLVEGIGSLSGWRKRVCQKKTETRWKIVRGSRKACQERCGGFRQEFARRFAEGIGKLVGNTPGDHRGEDQKTCCKHARGYWIGES